MNERGQISVLVVGFLGFLTLLTVVVVNASVAFLAHERLAAVADGAALAAADGVADRVFYTTGVIEIDVATAVERAQRYVADSDPSATVTTTVADGVVRVRLVRTIDLPLVPPGWLPGARVTTEATARLLPGR